MKILELASGLTDLITDLINIATSIALVSVSLLNGNHCLGICFFFVVVVYIAKWQSKSCTYLPGLVTIISLPMFMKAFQRLRLCSLTSILPLGSDWEL